MDCIKAVYGDIDPMNLSHKVPKLSLKVLDALVDEAHKQQLRTMVHCGNPEDTMDVVEIGTKIRLRNVRQITDGQPGDIMTLVKVK